MTERERERETVRERTGRGYISPGYTNISFLVSFQSPLTLVFVRVVYSEGQMADGFFVCFCDTFWQGRIEVFCELG